MHTRINQNENGWTIITCGELRITVPTDTEICEDRAEIFCNGNRVWVESHDDGPLVSQIERCSVLVHSTKGK